MTSSSCSEAVTSVTCRLCDLIPTWLASQTRYCRESSHCGSIDNRKSVLKQHEKCENQLINILSDVNLCKLGFLLR